MVQYTWIIINSWSINLLRPKSVVGEEENLTLALEQQECEEEERWVVEERRLAEERKVAEEKAKKEAECQGDSRLCTAIDEWADKVKSSRRSYIKYILK